MGTRGFFGRIEREVDVGCARLTETTYSPGAIIPTHVHDEPYACFVLEGEFDERFDGMSRRCGPSSFLLYPPGEPHSESFGPSRARLLNLEITSEWAAGIPDGRRLESLSAHFRNGPMAASGMRLMTEIRRSDTVSPLIVEGLILQLIGEVFRLQSHPMRRVPPRWLREVRDVLHARFSQKLSLSDLARASGVHPSYLASAFGRHFGTPIGDYVRRLRVLFALRQLSNPDLSLGHIALEAGFSDQSHFSREFKRQTGMTPSQYRSSTDSSRAPAATHS